MVSLTQWVEVGLCTMQDRTTILWPGLPRHPAWGFTIIHTYYLAILQGLASLESSLLMWFEGL